MGRPIAERLIDGGVPLAVWNRTRARAEALAGPGVTVADKPADAAAAVVLTILPDLSEVESTLFGSDGLIEGWRKANVSNPVLVVHGTVSPVAVREMAADLKKDWGVTVIDAPLSGGIVGAAAGRLSIMVGGDADIAAFLSPLFAIYGETVRHVGPSGSGALAKMCNQIVVASTVCGLAEASILARAGGLDLPLLFELLSGGLANSEVLNQKGSRFHQRDFDGGGSAANQLKDLRYIEESAQRFEVELPISTAARTLFQEMIDNGHGALDHTGVLTTLERMTRMEG